MQSGLQLVNIAILESPALLYIKLLTFLKKNSPFLTLNSNFIWEIFDQFVQGIHIPMY